MLRWCDDEKHDGHCEYLNTTKEHAAEEYTRLLAVEKRIPSSSIWLFLCNNDWRNNTNSYSLNSVHQYQSPGCYQVTKPLRGLHRFILVSRWVTVNDHTVFPTSLKIAGFVSLLVYHQVRDIPEKSPRLLNARFFDVRPLVIDDRAWELHVPAQYGDSRAENT